jgi:hypothetical protein
MFLPFRGRASSGSTAPCNFEETVVLLGRQGRAADGPCGDASATQHRRGCRLVTKPQSLD